MIPALIALFSILFFGGAEEVFFVDHLEKGVKKYVIEKDRSKEIVLELKEAKKLLKEFNKERKTEFKEFKSLYASKNTETKELLDFFLKLRNERLKLQERVLKYRVSIYGKINDKEWDSILAYSESIVDKKQKKDQKKKKSSDETYKNTRKVISEIDDSFKKKLLDDALTEMLSAINELANKIKSVNVKENDVLSNKDASLPELQNALNEMNELRGLGYKELVLFHSLVKENTNDVEWEDVMKAMKKDISLSAR